MHIPKILSRVYIATAFTCFSALATVPVRAATLAESTGGFSFSNFSIAPTSNSSFSFTDTLTTGNGSFAIADADAQFDSFPTAAANNIVFNAAATQAAEGSALAESEASIVGNFFVEAGDVLSFDFSGFIDLLTFTEQSTESANASLATQFSLFDIDEQTVQLTEIDFFSLSGQINTPFGVDSLDIVDSSDAVTLRSLNVIDETGDRKTEETAFAEVFGRYERSFDRPAALTLAELKLGSAFSQNIEDIPEPSSVVGLLLGMAGTALLSQRKHRRSA